MARRAWTAWSLEPRIRMVCPDVRRLLARVAVLAIRDRIARQTLHELHLSKPPPRVLNEPKLRVYGANQVNQVLIRFVTILGIVADRHQFAILVATVLPNSRNAVGRTIRTGPDYVRCAATKLNHSLWSEIVDVVVD